MHGDILFQAPQRARLKWLALLLLGAATFVLLLWSLSTYQPTPSFYGPRALYSMLLLSILLALLGRKTLLDLIAPEHRKIWHTLFYFDLCAPLYLAAGVLIGVQAAVITTMITQTVLQSYTVWRRGVSWSQACYQLFSSTIIVFVATKIYSWVAGSALHYYNIGQYTAATESREFLGTILTASVMLGLLSLASFPLYQMHIGSSVRFPIHRFQALALGIGILLPLVDIFDNIVGELAWLLFLAPLCAVYALMLSYVRFRIQTEALERSSFDLSTAHHLQKELRDYAALIIRIQEEERRRLSRDLLEEIVQSLVAISRGLDMLTQTTGGKSLSERDTAWVKSLRKLADQTLAGLRSTSQNLRPSILDDLGLSAALEWLCNTTYERSIPCTFSCVGRPRPLRPDEEITVFRIAQEALSNVWRHAGATQAQVTLQYQRAHLDLTIADNGKGFSQEHADSGRMPVHHGGLGLRGMYERAALIHAHLAITSSPGTGCIVRLTLPHTTESVPA